MFNIARRHRIQRNNQFVLCWVQHLCYKYVIDVGQVWNIVVVTFYSANGLVRGMFEMNCLLSYISRSTWGMIKTNIYLSRLIQGLHNGV